MKKITAKKHFANYNEWWGPIFKCPRCGDASIWHGFNYCPNCGLIIEFEKDVRIKARAIYDKKWKYGNI